MGGKHGVEMRQDILRFHQEGVDPNQIAADVGCSLTTVRTYVAAYAYVATKADVEKQQPTVEEVDTESIVEAILTRIETLKQTVQNQEQIISNLNGALRSAEEQKNRLAEDYKKVVEERDRAIKLHNEMVTRREIKGKITLDRIREALG